MGLSFYWFNKSQYFSDIGVQKTLKTHEACCTYLLSPFSFLLSKLSLMAFSVLDRVTCVVTTHQVLRPDIWSRILGPTMELFFCWILAAQLRIWTATTIFYRLSLPLIFDLGGTWGPYRLFEKPFSISPQNLAVLEDGCSHLDFTSTSYIVDCDSRLRQHHSLPPMTLAPLMPSSLPSMFSAAGYNVVVVNPLADCLVFSHHLPLPPEYELHLQRTSMVVMSNCGLLSWIYAFKSQNCIAIPRPSWMAVVRIWCRLGGAGLHLVLVWILVQYFVFCFSDIHLCYIFCRRSWVLFFIFQNLFLRFDISSPSSPYRRTLHFIYSNEYFLHCPMGQRLPCWGPSSFLPTIRFFELCILRIHLVRF